MRIWFRPTRTVDSFVRRITLPYHLAEGTVQTAQAADGIGFYDRSRNVHLGQDRRFRGTEFIPFSISAKPHGSSIRRRRNAGRMRGKYEAMNGTHGAMNGMNSVLRGV
jgi:hypothetical protein